ncbi:Bardet-Biedl syndrome 7 protein [Halotydeus destructor]|nr:Bardet-Biedl syndrome 7 protein [Halotydeus destructor]
MSPLNRIEYFQVGLTSKNVLRILDSTQYNDGQVVAVTAVIGDHNGILHCFGIRSDSSHVETIHQTMPMENANVNAVEVVGYSGSPKVVLSMGSLILRGYTRKGKNFLGVELNNLTEPIKHFKLRWPHDIYVCGHYIFSHYYINAENSASGDKGTIVQSKNFYVSPEKITSLILLDDKAKRKSATQDRLLRFIRDSTCEFEVETQGVPNSLINMANLKQTQELNFCYGCTDGKISMVSVNISDKKWLPDQLWEIPEKGTKPAIECMATIDSGRELYVARSDGSVEVWSFSSGLDVDGIDNIDMTSAPVLMSVYHGNESVTSMAVTHCGTLILCCTFTGVIFGLTKGDYANHKLNPNMSMIERDSALKIEALKAEIEILESRLLSERQRYVEMNATANAPKKSSDKTGPGLSALPYFAINDSFILQEDASYLLSLEVEVAIDSVIVQSDIALDLIDCERNSAVVSFSETNSQEVLATFRCQSNTTRLEIKIRSVEGQYGQLRIYIITRITPKSCQVKYYEIKPLSLHKRCYSVDSETSDIHLHTNVLTITGTFSLNESHSWIQQCLPEIPEKVPPGGINKPLSFVSTLSDTILTCEYAKGFIKFSSDNVSTISIIKDFITREATKRSTLIEMNVSVDDSSVNHTLKRIYPKIEGLVNKKRIDRLREAIKEVSAADQEVAAAMLEDLKLEESEMTYSSMNIERFNGLIIDLFIDNQRLRGSATRASINSFRSKMSDLGSYIDGLINDQADAEHFVTKLNQFWGVTFAN